jgi:hypothetical protein
VVVEAAWVGTGASGQSGEPDEHGDDPVEIDAVQKPDSQVANEVKSKAPSASQLKYWFSLQCDEIGWNGLNTF